MKTSTKTQTDMHPNSDQTNTNSDIDNFRRVLCQYVYAIAGKEYQR